MLTEQFSIIEKEACLSQKRLRLYSSGRVSKKEKIIIENHLLDCEKCIKALQHALVEKDTQDANRIFDHLFEEPFQTKKVNENPGTAPIDFAKTKRIFGFTVLAAIVCAGVFTFFRFFTLDFSTQATAGETPEPATVQKKNIEPEITEVKVNKTTVGLVNRPEPIPVPHPENNNKAMPEQPLNISGSTPAESPKPLPVITDKNVKGNPLTEKKEKALPAPLINVVPVKRNVNKPASIAEPAYINNYKISIKVAGLQGNAEQYKDRLEEILTLVDKAQYKDALSGIQKLLFNLPTDINAKYYRGYIYYLLQENEKSLTDFEFVLDNSNKTFFEDARWYKILLLNRNSRFDESKKMLNEVISENGSYRRKAQQLLELINGK